MFRRPLTGELAGRLYTMPPLPPTTTTLAAFKSLLLDRLQLLRIAGKFHVDNVLRIPHELEQELNVNAVASTSGVPAASSGDSAAVGSETAATVAPATVQRRNRMFSVTYPQLIKSECHAHHWMKALRNTHDYQMMRSRFLSLFLWPALLSSIRVEEHGTSSESPGGPVAAALGCGRLTVKSDQPAQEDDRKLETRTFISAPRPPYRSVTTL